MCHSFDEIVDFLVGQLGERGERVREFDGDHHVHRTGVPGAVKDHHVHRVLRDPGQDSGYRRCPAEFASGAADVQVFVYRPALQCVQVGEDSACEP